jgi:hypothetical protein
VLHSCTLPVPQLTALMHAFAGSHDRPHRTLAWGYKCFRCAAAMHALMLTLPSMTRRTLNPAGYAGSDGQHGLHDWAMSLWQDLPQELGLLRMTPASSTAAVLKRHVRSGSRICSGLSST